MSKRYVEPELTTEQLQDLLSLAGNTSESMSTMDGNNQALFLLRTFNAADRVYGLWPDSSRPCGYAYGIMKGELGSNAMRRVARDIEAATDTPHPELFGRIASAGQKLSETERAIALAVSASWSKEASLQGGMRECTRADLAAMAAGPKPKAALMAYLALSGLYCTEMFDFHRWSDREREEILDGLRALYTSFPEGG